MLRGEEVFDEKLCLKKVNYFHIKIKQPKKKCRKNLNPLPYNFLF